MIWKCALVDVGVSEQKTLFLRENMEARITCPHVMRFIGGRMSWEGGEVCGGGFSLSLLGTVVLYSSRLYKKVTA